jgi:hypothetical protein
MRNVTSKGPRLVFPTRFCHLVLAPHRQRTLVSDIRIPDPKSAAGVRTAWLTNHCRAVLTRWGAMFGPDSSPYLFPSSRIPETHMTDHKSAWRRAAAAGLKDRRIYDLRLTFASRANSCRASGLTVVHLLGPANHTNPCHLGSPHRLNTKAAIDTLDAAPQCPHQQGHVHPRNSSWISEVKPVHK